MSELLCQLDQVARAADRANGFGPLRGEVQRPNQIISVSIAGEVVDDAVSLHFLHVLTPARLALDERPLPPHLHLVQR